MKLNNLIQLINDLNQNMRLFLKIKGQNMPLAKLSFTADDCLLFPGKRAMTKKQLFKLIKKIHHREVTIWMVNHGQKIPVYGVQVVVHSEQAVLR